MAATILRAGVWFHRSAGNNLRMRTKTRLKYEDIRTEMEMRTKTKIKEEN